MNLYNTYAIQIIKLKTIKFRKKFQIILTYSNILTLEMNEFGHVTRVHCHVRDFVMEILSILSQFVREPLKNRRCSYLRTSGFTQWHPFFGLRSESNCVRHPLRRRI